MTSAEYFRLGTWSASFVAIYICAGWACASLFEGRRGLSELAFVIGPIFLLGALALLFCLWMTAVFIYETFTGYSPD